MRYSAKHKQETQAKLVESSRSLVKRNGFDATGVDRLMSAIGMTGGAFYGHFASKEDLFAAIVEREMEHSAAMLAADEQSGPDSVAKRLRRYLSTSHASQPETGCMLPSLGPEIARARPEVRATVERSVRKLQRSWSDRLDGDNDRAWGLLAQCVGSILLARVVESERTRQEILASNRRVVDRTLEAGPQD